MHREIKENLGSTNVSSVLNAYWCQRRWMSLIGAFSFVSHEIANADVTGMGGG